MSYGVNTWGAPTGRARAAGSSKRRSTRTGRKFKRPSARRARRSLPASTKAIYAKLSPAQKKKLADFENDYYRQEFYKAVKAGEPIQKALDYWWNQY
jgi:hypothetical protein